MSSKSCVLVVDDEPAIRNSLVEFLQDFQFDVYAAESAEQALEMLGRLPVDVALVDIRLPKMDGDSLIMEAHKMLPKMRFLIHTGSVEYKLPKPLKDMGMNQEHVFHKPQMDLSVFSDAICNLLNADKEI
jgi:DNA-binding NtrC family response regulator